MTWTQPMCERCWVNERSTFNETGWSDLLTVARPTMLRDADLERRCAWCGLPTFVGIYVRAAPTSVPYPADDR